MAIEERYIYQVRCDHCRDLLGSALHTPSYDSLGEAVHAARNNGWHVKIGHEAMILCPRCRKQIQL